MEFVDPCACLLELIVGKVAHFSGGEWPTKTGHPFVPGIFANDGQSLDVIEVPGIPLDVFPKRTGIPSVEIMHLHQDANFAVFVDQSLDFRGQPLVIRPFQFSVQIDLENLVVNFFVSVCGGFHMEDS